MQWIKSGFIFYAHVHLSILVYDLHAPNGWKNDALWKLSRITNCGQHFRNQLIKSVKARQIQCFASIRLICGFLDTMWTLSIERAYTLFKRSLCCANVKRIVAVFHQLNFKVHSICMCFSFSLVWFGLVFSFALAS